MPVVRVKKVFLDKNLEEAEAEVCPECWRFGEKRQLRYFKISLKESIYKCSDTKCMYPFVNYKYKCTVDQTVYRYHQVPSQSDGQSATIAAESARLADTSFDIDWLDGSSSLYDTVKACDTVPEEYSLDFLNLSDDNTLENYNIHEFIDEICNEPCNDEAAEQYIITELLRPADEINTAPSEPPSAPAPAIPATTTKLTKCLQFISKQHLSTVDTATTNHNIKKSPKRTKKVKRLKNLSTTNKSEVLPAIVSKPSLNAIANYGVIDENHETPVAPKSRLASTNDLSNLLHNQNNYSPLDWLMSLKSIDFKKVQVPVSPSPPVRKIARKKVKTEAHEDELEFRGFVKRSLVGYKHKMEHMNKLLKKLRKSRRSSSFIPIIEL